MVRYVSHERGRRCYVLGYRVHHFWPGVILLVLGAKVHRLRKLSYVGGFICGHDIVDFPWTDKCNRH